MATPHRAEVCPTRELLVIQFSRRLDHYHQALSALLNEMNTDKAASETQPLYEMCLEARKALHDHEREHGCFT